MYISVDKEKALFRTPFSETHDLVQKFRGLGTYSITHNDCVDFMESGLVRRDKWDVWHSDVLFSVSNDEAVPPLMGGSWIGAGHGHYGAIELFAPGHGKTAADVGSLWRDKAGVRFTLLRVLNADYLLFISDNIGKSELEYDFVRSITGPLTYIENGVDTTEIPADGEQSVCGMLPSNRHIQKQVYAFSGGKKWAVARRAECDSAQILEDYYIINPATVAPALRAARPAGGFEKMPNIADFGTPMLRHTMIFHILEDGTVLCDFDMQKLQDVCFSVWRGALFQEKLDVYGGGVYRHMPKTLPVTCPEGTFDFSGLVPLAPGPFPKSTELTRDFWTDPSSPHDRTIDYFRDTEGNMRLGFVCGYLPLYDGKPEKRLGHLTHSVLLYRTRKMYPTFMDGDIPGARGIAYKKVFVPEKDGSGVYTVKAEGKTFIYMDFFSENSLRLPVGGTVTLFEKSDDVTYTIENSVLSAQGQKGWAVFIAKEEK